MGVPVLAVLCGWGDAAKEPSWFTTAPSDLVSSASCDSFKSFSSF